MELSLLHNMVDRVAGVTPVSADRAVLQLAASDTARLRRWLDGRDVAIATALSAVCNFPQQPLAEAGRVSLNQADQLVTRATTAAQAPAFADALDAGRVSAGHLDAFGKTLRQLPEPAQAVLLDKSGELADIAETATVGEFEQRLRREAQRLRSDADAEQRLAAQKAAVRLSSRTDPITAMGHWYATWDPDTMRTLESRLDGMVERLFHAAPPEHCPTDPLAKQQFLRAHALLAIISGGGVTLARPEAVLVIRSDGDGNALIDYDLPIDLPPSALHDLLARANLRPVVVSDGDIVAAPGRLNLGRSARLANQDQRLALRAVHDTCAVPGCATPFHRTEIHHIIEFEHGGNTDLDNLVPICKHHHDLIHQQHWQLTLRPGRQLTIQLPDGAIMSNPGRPAAGRPTCEGDEAQRDTARPPPST